MNELFTPIVHGKTVVGYQPSLPLARAARDAALTAVETAAPDPWRASAFGAVIYLARTRPEFCTDDVWAVLEQRGIDGPREPRALGPVMMRAIRLGLIVDTGRMTPSKRRHATKITVWSAAPRKAIPQPIRRIP